LLETPIKDTVDPLGATTVVDTVSNVEAIVAKLIDDAPPPTTTNYSIDK
jgi:hypothetical protein